MSKKNLTRLVVALILCLSVTMLLVNCGPKKDAESKGTKSKETAATPEFQVAEETHADWPTAEGWAEWGLPNIVQPAGIITIGVVPMGNSVIVGMQAENAKTIFEALLSQVRKIPGATQLSEENEEHGKAIIFMVPDAGMVTVGYSLEDEAQAAVLQINKM